MSFELDKLSHSQQDATFTANSTTANGNIPLAGRFKRWIASLINSVILAVFTGIGSIEPTGILLIVASVGYFALQIWYMKNYQQTLGKRLLDLKVIDYVTHRPLSLDRYIFRECIECVFGVFSITIFSAACAFINKERRSLIDLMFSTVVVKLN
ncbi:RDD family protein [Actinobacillus succinogenes]|nr:RDD family protein [Actinobacillus succinogenes]